MAWRTKNMAMASDVSGELVGNGGINKQRINSSRNQHRVKENIEK